MLTQPIPPWAAVSASSWANASKAVMLTDMRCCQPESALAPKLKKGAWKAIPYETETVAGNLIWASGDALAQPLTLPLGATGWHALFIGLYATNLTPSYAWLKLEGEQAPTPVASSKSPNYRPSYFWIQEIFWKVAELKPGQSLQINQVPNCLLPAAGCGLAYVKLIPLADAEVAGYCADRDKPAPRRVAVTCDHVSFMQAIRPTTAEAVLSELEMFRNTDAKTLLLHVGGADQVCYPSRYGTMIGQEQDSFADPGQRCQAESIRELARKKINPTKVLIEGAHDIGMKVHVGFRPALWSYYEPYTDFFESPFFKQHPEWRLVDRDGATVARMSWAVPEVRRQLLDVLGEAVGFGAEGAHIVFNRSLPVTLYEPEFCAQFQSAHGLDPRGLEDSDPRIIRTRSDIITTFMRELRVVLDEEAKRRANGQRLEISLCVLGCEEDNLQYGLDLRRLAKERLIDEVYPSMHRYDFGATKHKRDMAGAWDLDFFMEACGRAGVPVIPMISYAAVGLPDYYPYATFLNMGLDSYAQGAAGMCFWDPAVVKNADAAPHEYWKIASRFGHVDELKARVGLQLSKPVYLKLRRLGEHCLDGRFPIWGGG